ncbi:anther-specific proline-rich protein APG-like [Salvia divinorum]|uniref:Anther-specific proline-rich protein APG-like n=1 Tax=Salvia divinorum TaxID=28513 RepID=A0ABD1HV23_SALDI
MAEPHPSKSERKRERQLISVPFIWEEKPGMPKKGWKPFSRPVEPPAPPAKFVVSVPFGWEEKPGTPLPYSIQPPRELQIVAAPQGNRAFPLPPPKLLTIGYGNWHASSVGNDDQGDSEGDEPSGMELDTCSVDTDDSFCSAKSLLANGLISTTAIASAVPVQQTSLALVTTDSRLPQSPGSPASETGSTCSYATGTASLVGASFLEWLFPLLVSNSNNENKIGYLEKAPSQRTDVQAIEYLHGSNCGQARRPLLTLGELIAMSRRQSCQRKVNKMHKKQSMDFMRGNAFGCCIFQSGNGINQLTLKWKRQLQLKLM